MAVDLDSSPGLLVLLQLRDRADERVGRETGAPDEEAEGDFALFGDDHAVLGGCVSFGEG